MHTSMIARSTPRLFAALLCAAASAACGNDGPNDGGGGGAATYATSECGSCVATACEAAFAACQAEPSCTGYLECLLGCPLNALGDADGACDEACVADESATATEARVEIDGCRQNQAVEACSACPAPPAPAVLDQTCEPRPEPAPTACRQWCCDTWDACFAEGADPGCDTFTTCIQACVEQDDALEPCVAACVEGHSDSVVQTFLAQYTCALSRCASEQPMCDAAGRDACDVCLHETCGEPLAGLLATAEGFLIWNCQEDCANTEGGVACVAECADAHGSAKEAFLLWTECVDYHCTATC